MMNSLDLRDLDDSLKSLDENYGMAIRVHPDYFYRISEFKKLKWIPIKEEMNKLRKALKEQNEDEIIAILEDCKAKKQHDPQLLVEHLFGWNPTRLNNFLKNCGPILQVFVKLRMWNLIDYLIETTTLSHLKSNGKQWLESSINFFERKNQIQNLLEMLTALESKGTLSKVKIRGMDARDWILKNGSEKVREHFKHWEKKERSKQKNHFKHLENEPTVGELLDMERAETEKKKVLVVVKKKRSIVASTFQNVLENSKKE